MSMFVEFAASITVGKDIRIVILKREFGHEYFLGNFLTQRTQSVLLDSSHYSPDGFRERDDYRGIYGVFVSEGVLVGVGDLVTVGVRVRVGVRVAVAVREGVAVNVRVGVGRGVGASP